MDSKCFHCQTKIKNTPWTAIEGKGALSFCSETCGNKFMGLFKDKNPDKINPAHYRSHPSGIEAIQITEHMSFTLGNAIKYIWRADLKHDAIEDLKKAVWYLTREIEKREKDGASK